MLLHHNTPIDRDKDRPGNAIFTARNAPNVLLNPKPSVKIAMPVAVSRIKDKNASWDLERATT
jgi:hypothetical protein